MSEFDDNEENIEQPTDIILVDEVQKEETLPFLNHCTKILKQVVKGAKKGQEVFHFDCNYCSKDFQGPSNSTFLKHLRGTHPKKCPELLPKENTKPIRNFFLKTSMKQSYDPDVFMGKLLKWISAIHYQAIFRQSMIVILVCLCYHQMLMC